MSRKARSSAPPKKRRTTLTLPADHLAEAQRIAHRRKVNLSTVVAEGLAEVLRKQKMAERAEEVLEGYRKAFSGLSDEEMDILDGIIPESEEPR